MSIREFGTDHSLSLFDCDNLLTSAAAASAAAGRLSNDLQYTSTGGDRDDMKVTRNAFNIRGQQKNFANFDAKPSKWPQTRTSATYDRAKIKLPLLASIRPFRFEINVALTVAYLNN